MRVALLVEYDGTDFQGWQIQPEARTVQGEIEAAAARLFGRPVRVRVAGRTDAGVHASGQVVAMDVPDRFRPVDVRRALQALTPRDIAVVRAVPVPDDFDPRRWARQRIYRYTLHVRAVPSPFWLRYAWHVRSPLNVMAMREAAAQLVGEHDFSSFRAAGCDAAHPVRRIDCSEVREEGDRVVYQVAATAFLRHMVRNIVGVLVEVGRGEREPGEISRLLAARDRTQAGITAPACGLCLAGVRFERPELRELEAARGGTDRMGAPLQGDPERGENSAAG